MRPTYNLRRPTKPVVVIGPSIAYIPLTLGQHAVISSAHAARCAEHNWHAQWDKNAGSYVAFRNLRVGEVGGSKVQSLHAFVLDLPLGSKITADHVAPGNSLNCLPHNLRPATKTEQCANRRLFKSNTSGYRGVHFNKGTGKWVASIRANRKRISLGYHHTALEAHHAYIKAARAMFGDFARL